VGDGELIQNITKENCKERQEETEVQMEDVRACVRACVREGEMGIVNDMRSTQIE